MNAVCPKRKSEKEKILNAQLKKIYAAEVKLLDKIANERKIIIKQFLDRFKQCCTIISPLFRMMFKCYHFTGSAFEGLQVKDPNEFDINIVFKFPFYNSYEVHEYDNPSSYATFRLYKSLNHCSERYAYHRAVEDLSCFFDTNNYLMGNEVLSWLQSIIDQCLNSVEFRRPPQILEITSTNSGPARTLKFRLADNEWISLDLVPVFILSSKEFLNVNRPSWIAPKKLMNNCFLVPKPLKNFEMFELSEVKASRLWRIHFAEAEVYGILKNRHTLKPLIKLVKRLRDQMDWCLPSYFIKMTAFWLVNRHPNAEYFESEKLQGRRFIEMLELLFNNLSNRQLRHIFYPEFNLLYNVKHETTNPICNSLDKIIKDLDNNPYSVKKIFRAKVPASAPGISKRQYWKKIHSCNK